MRETSPGPQHSDEDLVAAASATDSTPQLRQQAATVLLRRYQDRVFVWCLRYQPDRDSALDLTQEVLLRAYSGLSSFGGRSRFSSWLFAVTRNECLKSLRKPARFQQTDLDPDQLPGPAADPERELLQRLAEQDMLDLISRTLDPVEQRAIWLRCFDRMSVAAITDLLDIQDRTGARALLQRARRKLRQALKQAKDQDRAADQEGEPDE